MTILQIITLSELGGAQSVVATLSNRLCKEHKVIVVAGEGDGSFWKILDPDIKQVYCTYLKRRISPLNDIRTLLFFIGLYRRYRPDIIHLHSSKAGVLGRLAFPKNKIIYTVHGFDSIRLAHPHFIFIERLLQRRCRAIVGVSEYDVETLRAEGIIHHVYKIFNGIEKQERIDTQPFLFSKAYKKTILCIARIVPQKNHQLFLDIAKALPQYAFVWIGNQQGMSNTPSNTFFLGNIAHAAAYCRYADLFILPSNYEGLPMVIIEAMSHALPIVASNVGGVAEIVRNHINGFTIQNDRDCFVKAILSITENSTTSKQLSINSLRIFKKELTAKQMVDAYLQLYKNTEE